MILMQMKSQDSPEDHTFCCRWNSLPMCSISYQRHAMSSQKANPSAASRISTTDNLTLKWVTAQPNSPVNGDYILSSYTFSATSMVTNTGIRNFVLSIAGDLLTTPSWTLWGATNYTINSQSRLGTNIRLQYHSNTAQTTHIMNDLLHNEIKRPLIGA